MLFRVEEDLTQIKYFSKLTFTLNQINKPFHPPLTKQT